MLTEKLSMLRLALRLDHEERQISLLRFTECMGYNNPYNNDFIFLVLEQNWFYLCFWMTVLGAVSHIFMLIFSPESPKWLLV